MSLLCWQSYKVKFTYDRIYYNLLLKIFEVFLHKAYMWATMSCFVFVCSSVFPPSVFLKVQFSAFTPQTARRCFSLQHRLSVIRLYGGRGFYVTHNWDLTKSSLYSFQSLEPMFTQNNLHFKKRLQIYSFYWKWIYCTVRRVSPLFVCLFVCANNI